jgi:hypothetical protein
MVPAPRAPIDGGTSGAGLPLRVPMAQLPGELTQPLVPAYAEPDPQEVSSMLTRFYGGVHRAARENGDDER